MDHFGRVKEIDAADEVVDDRERVIQCKTAWFD